MADRTFSRTAGETSGRSLRTRETVLTETPHSLAISFIVISFTPLPKYVGNDAGNDAGNVSGTSGLYINSFL